MPRRTEGRRSHARGDFPYLAAKYGGGTFIAIYLGLVVTLGFTLMVSEIAIGRI